MTESRGGAEKARHEIAGAPTHSSHLHLVGPGPHSEDLSQAQNLHLLSSEMDMAGRLRVRYIKPVGIAVLYEIIDEFENLYRLTEANSATLNMAHLQLARNVAGDAWWAFESGSKNFRSGENPHPDWSLDGVRTAFLASGEESESEAASPASTWVVGRAIFANGKCQLNPRTRYRFSVLGALHRCGGKVLVEIDEGASGYRTLASRAIARKATGGRLRGGYDPIALEFRTPAKAERIRISVEKGPTEDGADSYLFLADPAITEITDGPSISLESEMDEIPPEAVNNAAFELVEVFLIPPAALVQDGHTRATLRLVSGIGCATRPVQLGAAPGEELATRFDRGLVHFEGMSSLSEVELGLYVDGKLSNRSMVPVADGRFTGSLSVATRHLDGLPHLIELRKRKDGARLARWAEFLPRMATSWEDLQAHARMPLAIENSPAATHHFRAFRRWVSAYESGQLKRLPPLVRLLNTLLEGIKPRRAYKTFGLPVHSHPLVSVVVPAHNKFEVTYVCLCALRFAHNIVAFEVIVVDDGSTDQTRGIADIVSGVKVVRNERALGFVGACNAGAAAATGRYLAFLNNDTEVTAGWLDELVDVFQNFGQVGLAGSKLLYPDGRLQEAGGIVWRSGNPWNVGRGENSNDPCYNYTREVDYVSGAAIMLRRKLFNELGGFSEEFSPAYFEDTDLAMKVRQSGRHVVYVPTSVVYHHEGLTAGTSINQGFKRYQEINRPKFRRKWAHAYAHHGEEGTHPEVEKDRGAAFRVLFVDYQVPLVDRDAGSYAAFQEIRLLQGLGGKVTFLSRNLAWLDRHTLALERIGVECLYAPYVRDFGEYISGHAALYDLVYVCRYQLAREVISLVRSNSSTKIAFNLADLHFLREIREAASGNPKYSAEKAAETRNVELEQAAAADLTLSYSDVEIAVLQSHLGGAVKSAKLPWVVDVPAQPLSTFADTDGALFLGSFGHPPNVSAMQFFVEQVMPKLREKFPEFKLRIAGGQLVDEIRRLESPSVEVVGYVGDLDKVFRMSRIFVAPLLAGAGIKGKVLEAAARGVPSVLSRIAAEGTGFVAGSDCLIADNADSWVTAITRLNTDEALWSKLSAQSQEAARSRFSFAVGLEAMAEALASINITGRRGSNLVYNRARPHKYGLD